MLVMKLIKLQPFKTRVFAINFSIQATGGSGPQYGRVYFTPTSFDADAFNKVRETCGGKLQPDLPNQNIKISEQLE